MMSKPKTSIRMSLLLRVGSNQAIERCYHKKTLTFSCAANWLDYALKHNDQATGDFFECAFAHVPKDDPRIAEIRAADGKPMGNNLLILENKKDNSCILRYVPAILMPAVSFYSFHPIDIIKRNQSLSIENSEKQPYITFSLDKYRSSMGYKPENASYLLINNVREFIDELKERIPIAVDENKENLTSKRFFIKYNPKETILCKDVNYKAYKRNEVFFCPNNNLNEMFWKLPEYEWQSEVRMVIPHMNFVQSYDFISYDYQINTLDVFLPKFQTYASIFPAKKVHTIFFDQFNETELSYNYCLLEMTCDDIQQKLHSNAPVELY